MPHAQTSARLKKLREKHSDLLGRKRSLSVVGSLGPDSLLIKSLESSRRLNSTGNSGKSGKAGKSANIDKSALKKLKLKAPSKFVSTFDSLSPSNYKRVFTKLYTFIFFMLTLLFIWIGYRSLLPALPVWFDEGVAKALIFGLPVVWFASQSPFVANELGLDDQDFFPGLFLGLAVGGMYGFVALLIEVAAGQQVMPGSLFVTSFFWWNAFLALLTAWWESLFFFGLPIQYVRSLAPGFSESLLGVGIVGLFLIFHAPLRLIVTGFEPQFLIQMTLLAMFAFGQFLFYLRTKNMYALVLSHMLWGLVIELYAL